MQQSRLIRGTIAVLFRQPTAPEHRYMDDRQLVLTVELEQSPMHGEVGVGYSFSSPASSSSPPPRASTIAIVGELQGVDLRAEIFIARFQEELRLQRQRSVEYQQTMERAV